MGTGIATVVTNDWSAGSDAGRVADLREVLVADVDGERGEARARLREEPVGLVGA